MYLPPQDRTGCTRHSKKGVAGGNERRVTVERMHARVPRIFSVYM